MVTYETIKNDFNEVCNFILSTTEPQKGIKGGHFIEADANGYAIRRNYLPKGAWDSIRVNKKFVSDLTADEKAAIHLFAESMDYSTCKVDENGIPSFLAMRFAADGEAKVSRETSSGKVAPELLKLWVVLKDANTDETAQAVAALTPIVEKISERQKEAAVNKRLLELKESALCHFAGKDGKKYTLTLSVTSADIELCGDKLLGEFEFVHPETKEAHKLKATTIELPAVGMTAAAAQFYKNHGNLVELTF